MKAISAGAAWSTWGRGEARAVGQPRPEREAGPEADLAALGLYRSARRAGLTPRSGVDCLIAACALRNALPVLHHDRDFDALARIAPLEVRSIG